MPKKSRSSKAAINALHRQLGTGHGTVIKHRVYGTGFWDAIKGAFNWIRDNKVISTAARLIPHPIAQTVGNVAGQVGLGRSRFLG